VGQIVSLFANLVELFLIPEKALSDPTVMAKVVNNYLQAMQLDDAYFGKTTDAYEIMAALNELKKKQALRLQQKEKKLAMSQGSPSKHGYNTRSKGSLDNEGLIIIDDPAKVQQEVGTPEVEEQEPQEAINTNTNSQSFGQDITITNTPMAGEEDDQIVDKPNKTALAPEELRETELLMQQEHLDRTRNVLDSTVYNNKW